MRVFNGWTLKQVALLVLIVGLAAQALAAVLFIKIEDFSLLDQGDSFEYVTIADHLIDGHGYSADPGPPWRPTASRVPGMLLVTLPMRYLLGDRDELVSVAGKLLLLAAALCMVVVAGFFMEGDWPWLAAPMLIFIPAVAYYGMNPYSTGPSYVLSYTILYSGMVMVLRGRRYGALVVGLGSLFSLSIRPAALFPLVALAVASLFIGAVMSDREFRRKMWSIGAAVMIGGAAIYVPWSYRNLKVFDVFQYSSVEGFHLLHFTAYGMEPYLDDEGRQELYAALDRLPEYITRYHERDQIKLSQEQGKEGLRLIRKYPVAFLTSHLVGSLKCLAAFEVEQLDKFGGGLATLAVAIVQGILTVIAAIGIGRYWRKADVEHRALIALMLVAGVVSIGSGGMLGQPRFRFPMEPLVVVGIVLFVRDFVVARLARRSAAAGM